YAQDVACLDVCGCGAGCDRARAKLGSGGGGSCCETCRRWQRPDAGRRLLAAATLPRLSVGLLPAYFAGARAYYAAPAYAPPPVVYYPPVILYSPPPVVAYPAPVAPYLYGARRRHLPNTAPIRTGDGEEVQLLGASSLRVRFSNSRRNSSFL